MRDVGAALSGTAFTCRDMLGIVTFTDSSNGNARPAGHVLFSGEKIRAEHLLQAPRIVTVNDPANFRVLALDLAGREMKLTSNRHKDGMYLRDLIGVGLVDASWLPKLPPELAGRLQAILDTPDG